MRGYACNVALVLLGLCAAAAHVPNGSCGALETSDSVASAFNLSTKVIIVTGGDSGLGFATATSMAKMGATVIIATHNLAKGEKAAQEIVNATGGVVYGYSLDLASFASVRAFAQKFTDEFHSKLDILFNNAGISGGTSADVLTSDGFEEVFQVNYLGPFLLTELLLPALRASNGRIVNTASTAHQAACQWAGLENDCLKDWTNIPPQPVSGRQPWYKGGIPKTLYGVSKFMQIMHAQELAVRESSNGVTAFSLCPGYVDTGMTSRGSWWVQELTKKLICIPAEFKLHQAACPYSAQQGAAVLAYAGLEAPSETSGAWYTRYSGCHPGTIMMNGFTAAMRPELYNKSLKWVGIKQTSYSKDVIV
jgi:NAD(P)-dependent dehydrogenase (short-subunit alcohol dehydrogenase family)